MADNIVVSSGTGVTIAADDDGSALHQWVKIQIGGDGSFVPITTANGLPVQILSLPAFAVGSIVSVSNGTIVSVTNLLSTLSTVTNAGTFAVQITSLPDLGLNSVVKITSLPDLGLNSSVKITSLPAFAAGSSVTISNLSSVPLTVSGTTIAITSLPDLGLNSVVKITSLPDLGLNSVVKITSLPALGFGGLVSISNGTIVSVTNLVPVIVSDTAYRFVVNQAAPISGYFRFTSTYTSAQTNVVLVALPGSTTALHITDCLFSNAQTHGSFTLLCSPSNGAVRTVLDRLYFRDYGGAVMNFKMPLVLDTNSALVFTSRTATDHSVTVIGYVR